ncbi:LAMI_0E13058g1_1 [Lachancea mirantina]|uniref:Probable cytosolic iron-sulfur protein assembly protein 1 n=1 Tax=Lachancea mirantina TaxID=1230905 RepID=A0A1G4JQX7_9SACH|nr:LAMI_0E13058g1_1 [Lachancea mirantina]
MTLSLVKSLKLHDQKVWSIDVSRGLLATSSSDRKIKLVNLKHQKFNVIEELDDSAHKKTVRSVAWRPHSHILAAGSFDSTISIWGKEENADYIDGELDTELLAIIEGHDNEVKSVAWSHDGFFLASCSRDKSVWIWEADEAGEEFECISVLQEHSQDVKHVVWHPSQALLASSSYDDTVRIWREHDDDWECAAVLAGHEGTVWCSDFAKSEGPNVRLCSASDDGTVRIWRYVEEDPDNEYEQIWEFEAVLPAVHTRSIYSVSWGSDGRIASVGSDGKVVVYKEVRKGSWEVQEEVSECHGVYEVNVVKWAEIDGRTVLVTGGDDGCTNIWTCN